MSKPGMTGPRLTAVFLTVLGAVAVTTASPARAQEAPPTPDTLASALGAAIRAACGPMPDGGPPAVVAGTVSDSASRVPLGRARVRMEWQSAGDPQVSALETETDSRGYYQFCGAPAGEEIVLVADLRGPSAPVSLEVEPGTLHVQHLVLALSDPSRPGILVGRVIDAGSRRPVANAEVELLEREGTRTLTNPAGYFSFGTQPWGVYRVSVRALGYEDRTAPVRIQGGVAEAVEIAVSTEPIPIAGVEVTVQGHMGRHNLDEMVRRMRLGFGSFVTRDRIERRPSARVLDLLRETPGLSVRFSGATPVFEVRGRSCSPDVYVDGVLWPFGVDYAVDLPASEIEAIEVYKGFAEVPGIFWRLRTAPCAVIVVWTR